MLNGISELQRSCYLVPCRNTPEMVMTRNKEVFNTGRSSPWAVRAMLLTHSDGMHGTLLGKVFCDSVRMKIDVDDEL